MSIKSIPFAVSITLEALRRPPCGVLVVPVVFPNEKYKKTYVFGLNLEAPRRPPCGALVPHGNHTKTNAFLMYLGAPRRPPSDAMVVFLVPSY